MSALKNKVIVVMGGTAGLGLSATRAFLREGAQVAILGRDPETLHSALDQLGSAVGLAMDASTPDASVRAVELAVKQFGRLDGLYHVAGGSGRRQGDGPVHELTDAGLKYTLELNLESVIYSNRAAIQQFLSQGSPGTILNMTSVLGFSPTPKFFATHVYAAAKAGIIGFTKSAAAYYAPKSIRLNALAPGLVETPMAQRALGNDQIMEYVRARQPLDGGRAAIPADYDAAAVWFMSDESRFCTGQVLAIDGGWSVLDACGIG
ncbi:MAG: SDR family NAD(P)-dependent oxidoreductase [Verrucomicrobiota bacterium]